MADTHAIAIIAGWYQLHPPPQGFGIELRACPIDNRLVVLPPGPSDDGLIVTFKLSTRDSGDKFTEAALGPGESNNCDGAQTERNSVVQMPASPDERRFYTPPRGRYVAVYSESERLAGYA
jgi:hypothetical protein